MFISWDSDKKKKKEHALAIRRNCNEEQKLLNVQLYLTLLCKGRYVFSWRERAGEFPYFFTKKSVGPLFEYVWIWIYLDIECVDAETRK